MMAGYLVTGTLLLMLSGASYSHPTKKGLASGSSSSSGYAVNPGSSWVVPAVSGSRVGSQAAPLDSKFTQPSAQSGPAVAAYSPDTVAAPVHPGYVGSSPAGSAPEISWLHKPHSFSGDGSPNTKGFTSGEPDSLDRTSVMPPHPPPPAYKPGELSHAENAYEHGNYESETEDQGFPSRPSAAQALPGSFPVGGPVPLGPGRFWLGYPYDYMFLTGQYPPGTVSHFNSNYEQGRDQMQHTHYVRNRLPAIPSGEQQVQSIPFLQQPSKPAQQRDGSAGYGGVAPQSFY